MGQIYAVRPRVSAEADAFVAGYADAVAVAIHGAPLNPVRAKIGLLRANKLVLFIERDQFFIEFASNLLPGLELHFDESVLALDLRDSRITLVI